MTNDITLRYKTVQRGPARGVSQFACRNFKMSRVGVLSRLHNAVGNLATYICLRQSFVAISFERCRYFLAHVACRNLPWQGLCKIFPCFIVSKKSSSNKVHLFGLELAQLLISFHQIHNSERIVDIRVEYYM